MNILLEVTPRTRAGLPVTLRMAHAGATSAGTLLNGHEWLPLISARPTISMDFMDAEGNLAASEIRRGSIEFRLGEVYENEIWSSYVWNKAPATIWIGEMGAPFAEYRAIHTGAVSAISRDNVTATLELIGADATLDVDLLSLTYKGTGGAEGPTDMEGRLKPWCSGYAKTVDPVKVDPAYEIYQVHGYGPVQEIVAVYERAEALDLARMKASVTTFAELAGLSLLPSEWAICLPLGMFRLGGAPKYKLSADVRGGKDGSTTPLTIQTIVPHLLKHAGVAPGKISTFADFSGITWDLYFDSQAKVGDVIRDMIAGAGGVFFADGDGVWHGTDFYSYKAPKPLTADRSTEPLVRPTSIKQLTVADPVWRVEVGYDFCHSVHTKNEVSPALDEALTSVQDRNQQIADLIDDLEDRVDNVTGVDQYPIIVRLDELGELGQRNLTALDTAAQAYRDEAFAQVSILRNDVLADGESWAEAIDNLTTTTGDLQSLIGSEATLRTNGDSANAAQIVLIGTKADDNAAAIILERNTRTTALDAQATLISQLEAEVDDAKAGILAEAAVRTSAISAETSARGLQISSLNSALSSSIASEATTRSNADGALSLRIDQISARAEDAIARITTEQTVRANADTANANQLITLQSNLNGTNGGLALVQQQITTTSNRLGVVEGKWVLTVQGGTDIAGMSIASGGGTSAMVFQAGALAFRNPGNGGADYLMEFVGGVLRVRAAMIGTANINSAHIQDLAVGTNKIAVNAVTVTHSAERGGTVFGNNTHQNVLSYNLWAPNDCDLIVMLHATQGFPSGDRLWECVIYIDGVQADYGGGQKTADTFSLVGFRRVGAGSHSVSATWRGQDGSVRLASMKMVILEARR